MKKPVPKNRAAQKPPKGDTNDLLHHIIANMATKDELQELRSHMATKDDIAELRIELQEVKDNVADIKVDVSYIKAELVSIRADLKNVQGYRQEIDYALTRIARIEKHLGIAAV